MSNLQELGARIDATNQKVKNTFGSLSSEQFNWKPNPDKWSIGQLIEHLNLTTEPYFPNIDAALTTGYKAGFLARLPFPSRYLGKMISKMTTVETTKPMKTVKLFTPSSSTIDHAVIDRFISNGEKLKTHIGKATSLDTKKILVPSPAAAIISFSLHELLELHVNHFDRHINQAINLMNMPEFPS